MIGRIILLPFWIVTKALGVVIGVIRLALGTGIGATRFVLGRRLGTIAVVAAAFILGKKYLEKKAETSEEK
jgi:hypothetical protein